MRLYLAAVLVGLCSTFAIAPGVASAQTNDIVGPHNPYCGAWQNGTWTPNGNCVEETTTTTTTTTTTRPADTAPAPAAPAPAMAPDRDRDRMTDNDHPRRFMQNLRGTITAVRGHLVTLTQSTRTLVVNDTPALNREDTGHVAVGRQVVAHGYWEGDIFYVTRFE
jgi:hypothetical protein